MVLNPGCTNCGKNSFKNSIRISGVGPRMGVFFVLFFLNLQVIFMCSLGLIPWGQHEMLPHLCPPSPLPTSGFWLPLLFLITRPCSYCLWILTLLSDLFQNAMKTTASHFIFNSAFYFFSLFNGESPPWKLGIKYLSCLLHGAVMSRWYNKCNMVLSVLRC